jgi:microcystin-dependent protein
MSDPFVAEIRIFSFNFAPTGWALCNGQLLPISQNTALFSLLGTMYGGDGKSTFALPNLQGSVPMFWGQGSGLSLYDQGQASGSETVTLLQTEMPVHSHTMSVSSQLGTENQVNVNGAGQLFAMGEGINLYGPANNNLVNMASQALTPAGGSLPHNNLQPYLVLNFCIAMQGVFPPRQ